MTIAIPPLEATCHSLNGWWSLTFGAFFLYVKIFSFEIFHIYIEKKNQIKFYIKEKAYD